MPIIGKYNSPRISSEILDCSMPLTFDQYSVCGYNCTYCFSQFIKGTAGSKKFYDVKAIRAVDVQNIKDIFTGKKKSHFQSYIARRIPLQWGGLADPMCPFEEAYRVGLELLQFFADIKYPLSFSSKSDLILRDERYQKIFKQAGKLWHYKASIITNDEEKARIVEGGVPSPAKRFEVLKLLSSYGVNTTLRMRPYIIGLTDLTQEDLIRNAKEAGCQSVSTEFFCLEMRTTGRSQTMANYDIISDVVGFNLIEFYKKYSGGRTGYLRLSYDFKKQYAKAVSELCTKYGISLHYSDNDFKHLNKSGSCCGILDCNAGLNNYAKLQFTNLIQVAKKKGVLTFEDAMACGEDHAWRKDIKLQSYMNLRDKKGHYCFGDMTYFDYFLRAWNDVKSGFNPAKYYGGILKIGGKDKNGNIVYFYDSKHAKL